MTGHSSYNIERISGGVLKKDRKSIADAITIAENDPVLFSQLAKKIYTPEKSTRIIGVAGLPGAGKSSLIALIAPKLAALGHKVGIIAVDASSPFTGGSFLGNRIRMQEILHGNDIFMRSMASRGAKGGLAMSIINVVMVLAASGFDYIIVEPVGAGQTDTDIFDIASTVVVVLTPGFGDEIQAAKAGLMEIGDIFVMNKADLSGADRAESDLKSFFSIGTAVEKKSPIILTSALSGLGSQDLVKLILDHEKEVDEHDYTERMFRTESVRIAKELLGRKIDKFALDKPKSIQKLFSSGSSPYSVAEKLIKKIKQ